MGTKNTGKKRVGKGRAGNKAQRGRQKEGVSPPESTSSTGTQEFPQVGDAIRTHRGAASGWASGQVKYRGENGAIIARVNDEDVGLQRGQYEPVDGNLPKDRHAPPPPDVKVSNPIIGPPGPVLGEHPSHSGAGQTVPAGRHLAATQTGGEAPTSGKKNDEPSFQAGPPPSPGQEQVQGQVPIAHPTEEQKADMEAGKEERERLDAKNAAAGKAAGK